MNIGVGVRRTVVKNELFTAFAGLEHTSYQVGETTTEAIDDSAVIVSAQLRYPDEQGGVVYAPKSWVLTFKDDLLYRSRAYPSPDRARAAYRRHGVELGM